MDRSSNTRIKLLELAPSLGLGGLERIVIDLCNHVDKDVFEIKVCLIQEKGEWVEDLEKRGIEVFFIPQRSGKDYLLPFRLAKFFKHHKFDIIHSHGKNPFFYGSIGAKLAGVPVFIHTDHAREWPDKKAVMVSEKIVSFLVDRIVAVSNETKECLIKYEGIAQSKIITIINGIDGRPFRKSDDVRAEKRKLDINDENLVVGFASRLEAQQKGIFFLVDAASIILKRIPNIIFLIVGDGPDKEEMEKRIKEYGIERSFVFLGIRKDVPLLLNLMDICVLPSTWEGTPLILLEAMAAGVPVVTTPVGEIPNIVVNGHTGLLVPPCDKDSLAQAMLMLLGHKKRAKKMGENARRRFEEMFDVGKMIRQYEDLFLDHYEKKK